MIEAISLFRLLWQQHSLTGCIFETLHGIANMRLAALGCVATLNPIFKVLKSPSSSITRLGSSRCMGLVITSRTLKPYKVCKRVCLILLLQHAMPVI
ncbi:MAG: hypothetical protein KA149_04655 [Chitinophagales bacterium]|nr:hypothetical protein [Chitinophagales bacterium]